MAREQGRSARRPGRSRPPRSPRRNRSRRKATLGATTAVIPFSAQRPARARRTPVSPSRVSVASGRCGPWGSTLPTGTRTAVGGRDCSWRTSSVVQLAEEASHGGSSLRNTTIPLATYVPGSPTLRSNVGTSPATSSQRPDHVAASFEPLARAFRAPGSSRCGAPEVELVGAHAPAVDPDGMVRGHAQRPVHDDDAGGGRLRDRAPRPPSPRPRRSVPSPRRRRARSPARIRLDWLERSVGHRDSVPRRSSPRRSSSRNRDCAAAAVRQRAAAGPIATVRSAPADFPATPPPPHVSSEVQVPQSERAAAPVRPAHRSVAERGCTWWACTRTRSRVPRPRMSRAPCRCRRRACFRSRRGWSRSSCPAPRRWSARTADVPSPGAAAGLRRGAAPGTPTRAAAVAGRAAVAPASPHVAGTHGLAPHRLGPLPRRGSRLAQAPHCRCCRSRPGTVPHSAFGPRSSAAWQVHVPRCRSGLPRARAAVERAAAAVGPRCRSRHRAAGHVVGLALTGPVAHGPPSAAAALDGVVAPVVLGAAAEPELRARLRDAPIGGRDPRRRSDRIARARRIAAARRVARTWMRRRPGGPRRSRRPRGRCSRRPGAQTPQRARAT